MQRGLAVLALAAFGCEPTLSRDAALGGKQCQGPMQRCLDGYTCSLDGICVMRGSVGDPTSNSAGASNSEPLPQISDTTSGGSSGTGAGGRSGAGGATGAAGSAATGSAGAAVLSEPIIDAGTTDPTPPDAAPQLDAGCTPVPLFRDRDRDGFGSTRQAEQGFGCPTPGWVTVGGDCGDGVATPFNPVDLAHPGQTGYFFVGFTANQGGLSFDFNCSGEEEPDDSNVPFEAAPDCALGVACGISGFRLEERPGAGVDSRCGSEIVVSCAPVEPCTASNEEPTIAPFRCR
jgi:hypothetical protein